MEICKSKNCHLRNHPEILIYFDQTRVLKQDAEWLVSHLESQVLDGVIFKADQTIQVGWMILKIAQEKEHLLTLQEPDFGEIPIVFNLSVNNTLAHLRMQKDVFESLVVSGVLQFPTILQSAIVCTRHDDSGGFFMERAKSNGNDSGWFLGCAETSHDHNDPKNLKRISLYEVACTRETIIPFMALPEGVSILSNLGLIKIAFNGQKLIPKEGSYLEKWLVHNEQI